MITEEQTKLLLDQLGISPDTLGQDKVEKLLKLADKIKDPSQIDGNIVIELQKLLGIKLPKNQKVTKKIGRNEPCPCNSGTKWKKCCYLTRYSESS